MPSAIEHIQTIVACEIPGRLAAALVEAQANAAKCKDESHDQMCRSAQTILTNVRMGLLIGGHRTILVNDCSWLAVDVVVFHESGEALPAFEIHVPMYDSLDQTIALAQVTAYSQVLGLRLHSPQGDDDRGGPTFEGGGPGTDTQDIADSLNDAMARARDVELEPVDTKLIDSSCKAAQVLTKQFGFDTLDKIYATATGRTGGFPDNAETIDHMAIVQLALLCEELEELGRVIPKTHGDFLSKSARMESAWLRPIFTNGSLTVTNDEE